MTSDRLLVAVVVCVTTLAAAPAAAQESMPQEGRSAQKTADAGLQGPPSQTVLTAADVEAMGITSLYGVAYGIPGLTLTPSVNSSNTPVLYLRGLGLDNPSQLTRDGAVAVYQDGFLIARPQAQTFDLLDLDHVEVLSGPQGAFYGRDTTGGVLNLISQAPAGELRLQQHAEFGNRNMFRVLASVDTPQWHGLSAKATLLASSIDGYVRNPLPFSHDYGEARERAARLQLRWDALSSLRADYSLQKSNLDSTPVYNTNPFLNGQILYSFFYPYYANPAGPTTTTYRPVDLPLSTANHVTHHLTVAWTPSAAFTVRSLTGYRTLGAEELQDYAEAVGIAETTVDNYNPRQFSEELQLTGSLFDQQFGYTLGGAYLRERGWHDRFYDFATAGRAIQHTVLAETRSEAAYLGFQWRPDFLRKRLEFTAAARGTRDVKDAERFEVDSGQSLENGAADGAVNHLSYRRLNPAGVLNYHWTESFSTYGSVSTGYRAGGALESAPAGEFAANTFRPESLLTYELGLHSAFWQERFSARLAAFSSRYRDIQYPIPIDAVTDQVYTLQQARIRGVDLGWGVKPLRDLTLSATVAFVHWTIDKAEVLPGTPLDPASPAGSPYTVGEDVADLFALPQTPRLNATAAGDYTFLHWFGGDLSVHLDYAYRGQFYNDYAAGPAVPGRQYDVTPAVGLLNARIAFRTVTDWSHHVKLGLWGRNVLNRKYYQLAGGYGSGVSAFQTSGGITTPVGWVARVGAWAEPASYGISASYEY